MATQSKRASSNTNREKLKLIVIVCVLAACLVWISYYALTRFGSHGRAEEANSPGWTIAKDINAKLSGRHEFADTGADVLVESPLKLRISGAVHDERRLDELKAFLKETAPDTEIEWAVEVLPH
jgi:hypothetical protein